MGDSSGDIEQCHSERPNLVWTFDFIFDRAVNGRSMKVLLLPEEFTRECIGLEVNRKFTGDDLVTLLVEMFAIRGTPQINRIRNSPEIASKRIREFLNRIAAGTSCIESNSPRENA